MRPHDGAPSRLPPEVRRGWTGFEDATWRTGAFRSLAIALLAGSTVVAPVAVVRAFTGWRLDYVFPLAILACLMGVVTTLRLGRPELRDRRGLVFRLGEILFIVVATRLCVFAFTGWPTLVDLDLWLRHPGAFMGAQTWLISILVILAWALALAVTADFRELAIQADEVAARESHVWGESESSMRAFRPLSRRDILARFASRWAWGGVPFVVLAGLSRVNISESEKALRIGLGSLGLPPDVLAGLLCYFLSGLFLLSDARLAVLRGQWYNQRVEVAAPVFRRWHWNSLLVLLAVAALALLLPIGSTGPLARALEWLLALLIRAGMFIAFIVSTLFSLLLYPLRWLFASDEAAEAPPPEEPFALPTQAEMVSQLQIPEWVRGALVWVVVALVAGYLLFNFLRGHGLLKGRWFAWVYNVRYWWRARKSQLDEAWQSGLAALRERLRRSRVATLSLARPRRARLDRMDSREKVRYFYLRAAERAAERGQGRPPHKTPLEYENDLDSAWPDAETDMHELTEAFLDARYAPREIAETEVGSVQVVWRRVMKALRRPTGTDARGKPGGSGGLESGGRPESGGEPGSGPRPPQDT